MNRFLLVILLSSLSLSVLALNTELKLYRPFNEAEGQGKIEVVEVLKGNCTAPSQFALREDAWRCQNAKKIFDPCFVNLNSKAKEVLCPASPWNGRATRLISLFEVLAAADTLDMSSNEPWALELTNQSYCMKTKSLKKIDEQAVKYRCSNGSLLFGPIQRCKALWSTLAYQNQQIDSVDIKKAWF